MQNAGNDRSDGHIDSFYAASVARVAEQPPLDRDRSAKVCVVGGGLTGLSLALELANRDIDVVVLEARRLGWAASGRNGGQALVGFTGEMANLRRLVGAETARALWDMSVDGVALIEQRCAEHGIDCDLRHGTLTAVTSERNMAAHAAWRDEAAAYGYDHLEPLDRAGIRGEIASDRYCGGLLDSHGRHLNPLKYCLGLARAVIEAGVTVHEKSPVTRIDPGAPLSVHTRRGNVKADHVVLACNAYLGGLNPAAHRQIMPVTSYVCATEPLGETRARALIPNDIAICDDRHVLDYYRTSADHRLLFGGAASYSARTRNDLRAFMRRRVLRVFPQLGDVGIDHAWSGKLAITRNRFPDLGVLAANLTYAQGYSGHGLAFSGIAGRALAAAIFGDRRDFEALASIPHQPFPGGRRFRAPLLVLGQLWYRLKDAL